MSISWSKSNKADSKTYYRKRNVKIVENVKSCARSAAHYASWYHTLRTLIGVSFESIVSTLTWQSKTSGCGMRYPANLTEGSRSSWYLNKLPMVWSSLPKIKVPTYIYIYTFINSYVIKQRTYLLFIILSTLDISGLMVVVVLSSYQWYMHYRIICMTSSPRFIESSNQPALGFFESDWYFNLSRSSSSSFSQRHVRNRSGAFISTQEDKFCCLGKKRLG